MYCGRVWQARLQNWHMARYYISPLAHAVHFGFVRIRLRSGCKLLLLCASAVLFVLFQRRVMETRDGHLISECLFDQRLHVTGVPSLRMSLSRHTVPPCSLLVERACTGAWTHAVCDPS